MTQTQRQELTRLIDALCEERASASERAQLEALVLSHPEALAAYVQAIELHGLLYWDAGGAGSLADLPVAIPREHGSRRRLVRFLAAGCAAALLCGLIVWQALRPAPEQPQLAVTPPGPAAPQVSPPIRAGERTVPAPLPDVHLPLPPSEQPRDSVARAGNPAAPPVTATLPEFGSDDEVVAFIDAQLQQAWEESNITPAPPASDEEFARRVYLDLTGRIPTLAESKDFLSDSSPGKRAALVSGLIEDRSFAYHLATTWTNLLVGRARSVEIDRGELLTWLEQEFAQRRPWKETVTDLVAARGTQENGPANFLLAHLNNEAVPATAITARILLCEQLQCAQCHQHPVVKEWKQERFWELNAFFQQARVEEYSLAESKTGMRRKVRELTDAETFGPTYYETLRGVMQVAFPRFADVEVRTPQPRPLREELADLLFEEELPQPGRAFVNRTWALLFGAGFTHPVDDMGPHNPVSHPELLDGLTRAFVESGYDVSRLVTWICRSQAYQLSSTPPASSSTADLGPVHFERMAVKPLTAEQLFNSLMVASGSSPRQLLAESLRQRREDWLKQFYTAVETEENGESTTFDGTLPQALMMINGDLVAEATSLETGRVLLDVLGKSASADVEKIRELCLAALGRYPTSEELAHLRESVRRSIRSRTEQKYPPQVAVAESLRDLYWAYLNSSEFVVNH